MFIAFEGPDNVGKSTAAAKLASDEVAVYNITRDAHLAFAADYTEPDIVVTYDRIDWLTHMVYRLALPTRNWNDDRPRTVFAMPDTHLVVKLHNPDTVPSTDEEEGYKDGQPLRVNRMYWYFTDFLMNLNRANSYELFKSVSIIEVTNTAQGFSQRLADHDSPAFGFGSVYQGAVDTDERLLGFLRYVDQHIG